MSFLNFLLGAQAAPEVAEDELGPVLAPGQEGNPIGVTGSREPAPTPQPSASEIDQYLTMGLDNTEAIRQRNTALKAGEKEADRKGMFGVGGTLRDVLGVLGDAFLVQSGNEPLYAPTREQERFSDAMAGSSVNPMAAYERAMGVNPQGAMDFRKDYVTGNNAATRNMIDQAAETRQLYNAASAQVSQMMAAALATGDPVQIENAKAGAQVISERTRIPLADLMAGGSPQVVAGRGATVNQSLTMPIKYEQLKQGRDRLNIALRGVNDREARTRLAEETLGLKRDDQSFDQILDLIGISLDVTEEQGRNDRDKNNGRRDRSTSESNSGGGGWTIRPAGQ